MNDDALGIAVISRDPFARSELVRKRVVLVGCECTECGSVARFRYGTRHDDRPGRVEWADGRFCGVDCFRTYHEVA